MWLGEAFLNIAKVSVCVCMCVWKRGPAYCRHKVYVQTVKQKKLKSFQFRGTETAQPTFQVSSIVSEQNTSVRHQQAQRKRRTGETASPRGDGDRVIRRGELSISQEYSVKTATLIFIFFIHCISYCTLTKTQFLSVIFVSLSSSGWKSRLHISLLPGCFLEYGRSKDDVTLIIEYGVSHHLKTPCGTFLQALHPSLSVLPPSVWRQKVCENDPRWERRKSRPLAVGLFGSNSAKMSLYVQPLDTDVWRF